MLASRKAITPEAAATPMLCGIRKYRRYAICVAQNVSPMMISIMIGSGGSRNGLPPRRTTIAVTEKSPTTSSTGKTDVV